jgi:hypothetical protein
MTGLFGEVEKVERQINSAVCIDILWHTASAIASLIRGNDVVPRLCQRNHLMSPTVGCLRETVSQNN